MPKERFGQDLSNDTQYCLVGMVRELPHPYRVRRFLKIAKMLENVQESHTLMFKLGGLFYILGVNMNYNIRFKWGWFKL